MRRLESEAVHWRLGCFRAPEVRCNSPQKLNYTPVTHISGRIKEFGSEVDGISKNCTVPAQSRCAQTPPAVGTAGSCRQTRPAAPGALPAWKTMTRRDATRPPTTPSLRCLHATITTSCRAVPCIDLPQGSLTRSHSLSPTRSRREEVNIREHARLYLALR